MTRDAIVQDVRGWLEASSYPRLHASFIVFVAGGTAFLASLLLLGAGVHSMALRYGIAGLTGYLVFLLMIRAWVAWQRRRTAWDPVDAPLDVADGSVDIFSSIPGRGRSVEVPLWGGGRSGGAGATGNWGTAGPELRSADAGARSSGGSWSIGLDLDDLIWIIVALAAIGAGVVAIGFVIYSAPVLLAEVALDAALVSTAYRKLRREEAGHWAGTVLRRTWIPAAVVILTLVVAGFALQQAVPEARSIGGVVRGLID